MRNTQDPFDVEVFVRQCTDDERGDHRADGDGRVDPADVFPRETSGVQQVPKDNEPGTPDGKLQKVQ